MTRAMCHDLEPGTEPNCDMYPIQVGMGRSPWRVAVASMLLAQTQRKQMEHALRTLLDRWPKPRLLLDATAEDIAQVLRPCGFQNKRAKLLQHFTYEYFDEGWQHTRQLKGVGTYVNDAIGLFCFGCNGLESTDHALRAYVSWKTTNSTDGSPSSNASMCPSAG